MKISLFYEFALPRPWTPDDEHVLLQDCLNEVEAADKAGFSTVWLTEHHFLEEYCHSTAPEIFLAAASQRTKNIRLGFGIMHLPPVVNHPARVAERLAADGIAVTAPILHTAAVSVSWRRDRVDGNGSASVWDAGDGVACLELHSRASAIDLDMLAMIARAV